MMLATGARLAATEASGPRSPSGVGTAAVGATGHDAVRVSLVVPCYNEERSLPYLANTLRSVEKELSKAYELELIFVDDGSVDGTQEVLRQMFGTRPNCTLLRHDQNRGVAASIMTGIKHARTDIVASIDCDCSYDPHELPHQVDDAVGLVTARPTT
jgi:glycosyltransferase involved in cell wall biosynthesis